MLPMILSHKMVHKEFHYTQITGECNLRVSVHSVGPYLISKPRAIHFAPTILPQDTRVSLNWPDVYEGGRRIDMILTMTVTMKCFY